MEASDLPGSHQNEQNQQPKRTASLWFSTTSVHVTALDGIVNVNALFTVAVFIGLSLAPNSDQNRQNNNNTKSSCIPNNEAARTLVVYDVVAFSFFLFSSLIAQGLKLTINILNSKEVEEYVKANINLGLLKVGMLSSAIGSVMGCLFLMLAMVSIIEIKLGSLSCGGKTVYSVATLITLVAISLSAYISTAVYAFIN